MLSNRLAFGALALACVTAAAGGGYLATRQANVSTEAAAPASADAPATSIAAVPIRATDADADATPAAPPEATPDTTATAVAITSRPAVVRLRPEPVRRPAAVQPPAVNRLPTSQPAGERPSPVDSAPVSTGLPPATIQADSSRQTPLEPLPEAEPLPSTPVEPVNLFEELVVSADSVIGLELDRGVTSERARVEDDVDARVVRDVRVGRLVAIPAGARALGSVMLVERGGKFKERARLGIRFHTLVLPDGARLPIQTDTIYRYGEERGDRSAKKIGGGAVAGAILGALIGGARGAAVGATAGAGGGTAMVMAGERSAAEFQSGAEVTARILSPVSVTVER